MRQTGRTLRWIALASVLVLCAVPSLGQVNTSVVFDSFGVATSDWRVDFLSRTSTADLDGAGGVAC